MATPEPVDFSPLAPPIDANLGKTLDAVNESLVAEMVKAGSMPASVLDHLGHVRHNIYSPTCEHCTRKVES